MYVYIGIVHFIHDDLQKLFISCNYNITLVDLTMYPLLLQILLFEIKTSHSEQS